MSLLVAVLLVVSLLTLHAPVASARHGEFSPISSPSQLTTFLRFSLIRCWWVHLHCYCMQLSCWTQTMDWTAKEILRLVEASNLLPSPSLVHKLKQIKSTDRDTWVLTSLNTWVVACRTSRRCWPRRRPMNQLPPARDSQGGSLVRRTKKKPKPPWERRRLQQAGGRGRWRCARRGGTATRPPSCTTCSGGTTRGGRAAAGRSTTASSRFRWRSPRCS